MTEPKMLRLGYYVGDECNHIFRLAEADFKEAKREVAKKAKRSGLQLSLRLMPDSPD